MLRLCGVARPPSMTLCKRIKYVYMEQGADEGIQNRAQ